jgi:hypothetical protein
MCPRVCAGQEKPAAPKTPWIRRAISSADPFRSMRHTARLRSREWVERRPGLRACLHARATRMRMSWHIACVRRNPTDLQDAISQDRLQRKNAARNCDADARKRLALVRSDEASKPNTHAASQVSFLRYALVRCAKTRGVPAMSPSSKDDLSSGTVDMDHAWTARSPSCTHRRLTLSAFRNASATASHCQPASTDPAGAQAMLMVAAAKRRYQPTSLSQGPQQQK